MKSRDQTRTRPAAWGRQSRELVQQCCVGWMAACPAMVAFRCGADFAPPVTHFYRLQICVCCLAQHAHDCRATIAALMASFSAYAPSIPASKTPNTGSPTTKSFTPSPILATTPEKSRPKMPASSVRSLPALPLGILRDHGIGLIVTREGIDTTCGSAFTVPNVIERIPPHEAVASPCRPGKAVALGKTIGRPKVTAVIRDCIRGVRGCRQRHQDSTVNRFSGGRALDQRLPIKVDQSPQRSAVNYAVTAIAHQPGRCRSGGGSPACPIAQTTSRHWAGSSPTSAARVMKQSP